MQLKAILEGNTAYSKLLFAAGLIVTCAVLSVFLSLGVACMYNHIGLIKLQSIMDDYNNPVTISSLKIVQVFSSIGTFILPALLVAFLYDREPLNYLSLRKNTSGISIILVVVALVAALPVINYLGELNSRMALPSFLSGVEKWMKETEDKSAELMKGFMAMNSLSDVLFNVFMIALLPAIGEELLFRGIIQRLLNEWSKNIHVAVWTSAILFSAMHMQFYGFVPRMILGAMLGYLLAWSGSLWLPIVAHFVNNAAAVIMEYLFRKEMVGVDPDKLGTEGEMTTVLISIVVTAGLLWLVYRNEKKKIYSTGMM